MGRKRLRTSNNHSAAAAAAAAAVIEKVDKEWLFGFTAESEHVLKTIIGFFQTESYSASPDNLQTMSDNPLCEIWVARDSSTREIVAACQTLYEGFGTDDSAARSSGGKHTESASWTIQSTYPTSKFESHRGVRIENFGGNWKCLVDLVSEIEKYLLSEGRMEKREEEDVLRKEHHDSYPITYMALRCDLEDYVRFKDLNFMPIALSEPGISLRFKLLLFRAIGTFGKDSMCSEIFSAHFLRHVIFWLSSVFIDAPADVLADILHTCASCRQSICLASKFDAKINESDLSMFLSKRGLARLRLVDPSDLRSIREHQDVIRAACILYFGCYIKRRKTLEPHIAKRLIEIGLQNNLSSVESGDLNDSEASEIRKFFKKIISAT